MSIFDHETLACPKCGREIDFAVARSVLADRRPDLREQIMAGTFQIDRCPHCETRLRREPDLNYVDIGRAQWILARPAPEVVDWGALEAQALGIYELAYGSLAPAPAQEIGRGMQVRVEQAVAEDVADEVADDVAREAIAIEIAAAQAPGRVAGRLHRAQMRERRHARHELHDERPPRRQIPEHGRHALDRVVGGVAAEPIGVACLGAVVELLAGPRREFVHRLQNPEQRLDPQPANDAHRDADETNVSGELDVDRRTLDLHRQLLAAQICDVHLPD